MAKRKKDVAPPELADQLRKRIDDCQWTPAAIARAAGIPHQRVLELLKGKDIRVSTAGKILVALGGSIEFSAAATAPAEIQSQASSRGVT